MFKAIIVGIFIFLVVGIVSISFWYKNKDDSLGSLYLKQNIIEPRLLSIKEVDLITAKANFHFTVLNKVN